MRMPLLLDGGEAEPADDRPGPGEQKAGDEPENGPGRRGIEAGGEGGGNAGERAAAPRTRHRSARHTAGSHRARCGDSAGAPHADAPPDPAQRQPTQDREETRQQIVSPPHQTRHVPGAEFASPCGIFSEVLHWRRTGRPRRTLSDAVARIAGRERLLPGRPQPALGLHRRIGRSRSLRVQVQDMHVCVNKAAGAVTVCTRGGNQSWNGLSSASIPQRCDYLFVLVGDGRRWFIPADALEAATGLSLAVRSTRSSRSSQARRSPAAPTKSRLYNRLLTARGDVRVAKGAGL